MCLFAICIFLLGKDSSIFFSIFGYLYFMKFLELFVYSRYKFIIRNMTDISEEK